MARRRRPSSPAPTATPRGPALIRRRVAIGAMGAGAVAAALAVACGGKSEGDGTSPVFAPPPQANPPVLPPQPPQVAPQVPPQEPPQPFDGGQADADASDAADAPDGD